MEEGILRLGGDPRLYGSTDQSQKHAQAEALLRESQASLNHFEEVDPEEKSSRTRVPALACPANFPWLKKQHPPLDCKTSTDERDLLRVQDKADGKGIAGYALIHGLSLAKASPRLNTHIQSLGPKKAGLLKTLERPFPSEIWINLLRINSRHYHEAPSFQ